MIEISTKQTVFIFTEPEIQEQMDGRFFSYYMGDKKIFVGLVEESDRNFNYLYERFFVPGLLFHADNGCLVICNDVIKFYEGDNIYLYTYQHLTCYKD